MGKILLLIFGLIIGLFGQIFAQKEDYKLIQLDSVPMTSLDFVTDFDGKKVSTATLTTNNLLYYSAALTPSCRIQRRFVSNSYLGDGCFKFHGGERGGCINYTAIMGNDTIPINKMYEFIQLFAPVTSVQEAIAFAYILLDLKPIYNLDFLKNPVATIYDTNMNDRYKKVNQVVKSLGEGKRWSENWILYQPVISSSYAKEVEDGYELLLYYRRHFACEHPYDQRLVKVYRKGSIRLLDVSPAFENIGEFGECVD